LFKESTIKSSEQEDKPEGDVARDFCM